MNDQIEALKSDLGWEELLITRDYIISWWEDFERGNRERGRVEATEDLLRALRMKDATISEFYWAYVFSQEDEIEYNLSFLSYLKDRYARELRTPVACRGVLDEASIEFKRNLQKSREGIDAKGGALI